MIKESLPLEGYDPRSIANYFLDLADKKGQSITHLQIQKILFFAHGHHLWEFGLPLVNEEFEAWPYGPVLASVHEAFKQNGSRPITKRASAFDPVKRQTNEVNYSFPKGTAEFLAEVFDFYGAVSAFALVELAHAKEGPWEAIWSAKDKKINVGLKMNDQLIRDCFPILCQRLG